MEIIKWVFHGIGFGIGVMMVFVAADVLEKVRGAIETWFMKRQERNQ